MAELGSALRHSDEPNFRIAPFLFMPEGNLDSASVAAMAANTASHEQRKRSLDALERRFAAAKTEHLQQQQQQKKTKRTDENQILGAKDTQVVSTSSPSLHRSSSKRGSIVFSGPTSYPDLEDNGWTYLQLSQSVHENLVATDVKVDSKRGTVVDKILHELLQHGDSAQKYMQGSRSMKIDNWILLDNYVPGRSKSGDSVVKALLAHSKRSKKHMSMKQHKKSGSFDLPKKFHKYDVFMPMHEIWKDYMKQLLTKTGMKQLAQCLLRADLHGAIILVAECKIPSFTGVYGIMIRETAETFGIITQDNKFHVVPKKFSVFIFQIQSLKITLNGDKFTSRNWSL